MIILQISNNLFIAVSIMPWDYIKSHLDVDNESWNSIPHHMNNVLNLKNYIGLNGHLFHISSDRSKETSFEMTCVESGYLDFSQICLHKLTQVLRGF